MKPTTVDTKTFAREFEWCARFIERKTNITILSNILMRHRGGMLELTGTDLELSGITAVEAKDGEDFALTVPVHTLLKYVKKIDERTVLIAPEFKYLPEKLGPHLECCAGAATEGCCEPPVLSDVRLTLRHGEDSTITIDGMSVDSYPELPAAPMATHELTGLQTAIERVSSSISKEDSRFTLNGALLDVKDGTARLIATDGHRLSVVDLKADGDTALKVLIPKQSLLEIARVADSAFMAADENFAFFTFRGERTIVTRKLTGNFPDWERIMPKDLKYAVTVPVAPLRKVLDRVSLFANERSHAILTTINGSFRVSAQQHEHSASGQVPCDGPTFAYPYIAGFNAEYISDFLKVAAAETVYFQFTKSSEASQWFTPGWTYVLMPMREMGADPCLEGEFEPVPEVIAALDAQLAETSPEPLTEPAALNTIECDTEAVLPRTDVQQPSTNTIDAVAVAKLLGIHQATVYNWVKRGKLPKPERINGAGMWPRVQIEQLCAS